MHSGDELLSSEAGGRVTAERESAIIHDFAAKSSFFMSLGASRLKRRILALVVGLWAILNLFACGGSQSGPPSHLTNRVLVAQGVSSTALFGGLVFVNGQNDTLVRVSPLGAGSSPALMTLSPTRNIVAAFDAGSNSVYASDTTKETSLGQPVHLAGSTSSLVVPTTSAVGYAAVPAATVSGFSLLGAVQVLNLSSGSVTTTIAMNKAQTIVATATGSQLLVFSNDSDSITVLTPGVAVPSVDLSCYNPNNPPPNAVCSIVNGFNRPVTAVLNGTTAYILNCGFECGGSQQASVQALDLNSLATGTPILGTPVNVNGATFALLNGTKLYVAGKGTPTGPLCSSLPNAAQTAATYCGTLDIVDLPTMTDPYFNNPATEIAVPDGYLDRMDISSNGQLFVGSHGCQDIGDVNNPSGEVRGCLAIYNTNSGAVIFPPDNGSVDGLQSFTSRYVEYVAEGGNLRVYDTIKNILLINDFLPLGTITVVGYAEDVKAIDFF
jgi:hypothetical protein